MNKHPPEIARAVGLAIEKASKVRAFGLYDYSKYPGEAPPHVVRNELTGERLLATFDKDNARATYEDYCRDYIAQAAIDALCGAPAQAPAEPVMWVCLVPNPLGELRIRAWTADRQRMESLRAEGLDMQALYALPTPYGKPQS